MPNMNDYDSRQLNAGSLSVNAPQPPRETEIRREIILAANALDALDNAFSDHYNRIEPILRQEPRESVKPDAQDKQCLTQLGAEFQRIRQKIQQMTLFLQGATATIEL